MKISINILISVVMVIMTGNCVATLQSVAVTQTGPVAQTVYPAGRRPIVNIAYGYVYMMDNSMISYVGGNNSNRLPACRDRSK